MANDANAKGTDGQGADPPNRITLDDHARISAEIAEGTRPYATVLEDNRVSDDEWNAATQHWMMAMAEDAQKKGIDAELALTYSEAFAKAQDAQAPVVAMTPEEWAVLTVELQQQGPTEPLARRNLSTADFIRLARHFAKRLSSDAQEQERFFTTYTSLQPQPEGD